MSQTSFFSRFSFRSLTPQLFALVFLPLILLLLVITFGGMTLHQDAMRTLVAERDQRAVEAAAQTLGEQLEHRATAIRTLALRVKEDMSQSSLAKILGTNDFPPPDFDHGLAFLSSAGQVLASTGDPSLWNNFESYTNSRIRSEFNQELPSTFIQLNTAGSENPILLVTSASYPGGPIAVGAFAPAELAHQALGGVFSQGESSMAFMVDTDLNLLYQDGTFPSGDTVEEHPGVIEALMGETGANFVDVDGIEHVIAYSPVQPVGWALVIEEPWDAVASPLLRTTENAPLVLVPALVLAMVALWFGLRQVVQPLQSLGAKATQVGWGNFEAIMEPVGGITEIQRLQGELIHLTRKVQAAQQGLRGYIGTITTGQEEERRRLARELHDDTLQALIALNQRVQLARLSSNRVGTGDHLAEIEELTAQTIANLRRITRALRPIYLEELGLVAALEALARETRQTTSLNVGFVCEGQPLRLSDMHELALYRIAQEAMNNILRHAEASTGQMTLRFQDDSITLEVKDDGIGFVIPENPADLTPDGHFGLLGVYERAELIGARLAIESAPEKGTIISITITPENK